MMRTIHISSLSLPELACYRTLRQSAEHFRQGKFIAEGEKVVSRLLESTLEIISVLIAPEWLIRYEGAIERRSEEITVYVAEKKIMESIVGFRLHQGIMALGKIPEQHSLKSVLSNSARPHLFAAVDGLTNSENLGVLVRNCAAFGTQAILAGETSSSPYLRRAVRNSMGTVFKIPVIHTTDLCASLQSLKKMYGFSAIAAHPHTDELMLQEADFSKDCCIVFGSEGSGISRKILAICDCRIAIPMQSGVDSLNVASASAVFLYEVFRKRNGISTSAQGKQDT